MPKVGLDFFPFDTVMDDKPRFIEAEFGLKGFAVIVKLWQRIYGDKGYYCEWTNDVALLFSTEVLKMGYDAVSEIVKAAIRRGIFDADMYKNFSILTSSGIQRRYVKAAERRTVVEIREEYLLISRTLIPKNVHIISGNVCKKQKNADTNEQSILKKDSKDSKDSICKGDEKGNNNNAPAGNKNTKAYGEFKNVFLTDEEYSLLQDKFPDDYEQRINKLSCGLKQFGYRYKSHYAAVLAWAMNDKKKVGSDKAKGKSNFHNMGERDIDFDELESEYFEEMM